MRHSQLLLSSLSGVLAVRSHIEKGRQAGRWPKHLKERRPQEVGIGGFNKQKYEGSERATVASTGEAMQVVVFLFLVFHPLFVWANDDERRHSSLRGTPVEFACLSLRSE